LRRHDRYVRAPYYVWANETGPADQQDAETTLRGLANGAHDG